MQRTETPTEFALARAHNIAAGATGGLALALARRVLRRGELKVWAAKLREAAGVLEGMARNVEPEPEREDADV